jgi:hypothetical protein
MRCGLGSEIGEWFRCKEVCCLLMMIPRDDDSVRWIIPHDYDAARWRTPRDDDSVRWKIPRDHDAVQ